MSKQIIASLNRIANKLDSNGLFEEASMLDDMVLSLRAGFDYRAMIRIAQSQGPVNNEEVQQVEQKAKEIGWFQKLQSMFGNAVSNIRKWSAALALLAGACSITSTTGCQLISNLTQQEREQLGYPKMEYSANQQLTPRQIKEAYDNYSLYTDRGKQDTQAIVAKMAEMPPFVIQNNILYELIMDADYTLRYRQVPYMKDIPVSVDLIKYLSDSIKAHIPAAAINSMGIVSPDTTYKVSNIVDVQFVQLSQDIVVMILKAMWDTGDREPKEI